MSLSFRGILLFAIVQLLAARPACSGLDLKELDDWQQYNGWRIRVIEFPGIKTFSRAELLMIMATEKPTWLRRYVRLGSRTIFFPDDFASDILRVERYYRREGFIRALVFGHVFPDPKRKELRLQFEIHEGDPVIVSGWNLEMGSDSGAGIDSARWATLMPIKVGKRLAESAVKSSADTLVYRMQLISHARARVETRTQIDSIAQTGTVTFVLYPGEFCYFGNTDIQGLKQVSEGTARRELAYREQTPFSPVHIERTRMNLVRLETFRMVSVRADTSEVGNLLPVHIVTQEGNRYRLRFGLGYHTEQRWRADTEFADLNFFGRGRRFTLSGVFAEFQREARVRLFSPHIPWNRTDLTISPAWTWVSEPRGKTENQTVTTTLTSSLSKTLRVSLSNEAGATAFTQQLPAEGDSSGPLITVVTHTIKSIETFSVSWDTRDHPLVPRRGHFLGATLGESGVFYRVDYRYLKSTFSSRVYIPVTRFTTFAGKAEYGVMGPVHDSPETPLYDRFTLGGPSTVRGWQYQRLAPRDPADKNIIIGGDAMFNATAELRRNVWGPVILSVFIDAGNVWRNPDEYRPLDLYPSVGPGLMVLTLVGPVRVDFGYQLRPNPFDEKINYAFNFSFGTPF